MPLEKVKELIDDVDILGCEQISFSGGEPFLHKDLVKMVAYAYRKGMRVLFIQAEYIMIAKDIPQYP